MKFRFKKFINRGVKKYCLLDWKDVKAYHELPSTYTDGFPRLYRDGDVVRLAASDSACWIFYKDETLTPKEYESCMTIIRDAGNRLHEINKLLKKENEDWEGIVEVVI